MTDNSRRRFYFPAWNRAWGRLRSLDLSAVHAVDLPSHLLSQVVEISAGLPDPHTADAMRHACHLVALGRAASSKTMTAADCDRVVCLFRLLANPADLDAAMAWEGKDRRSRNRLLWALHHAGADAPYIHAISRDKFGGRCPDRLDNRELHDLVRTIKARVGSRAR